MKFDKERYKTAKPLVTSRWPMDLPAFMREVMRMLGK